MTEVPSTVPTVPRPRASRMSVLAPALVLLVLVCAGSASGKGSLSALEDEFERAIKVVTPATVVCLPRNAPKGQPPGMAGSSGVIMSRKGLVLSDGDAGVYYKRGAGGKPEAVHGDDVEVRLPNLKGKGFQSFPATVIKRDRELDTSLLRIEKPPSGLKPLKAGSSDALKVGDFAFAMGNAFGMAAETAPTLTAGVVSSLVPNPEAEGGRWRHIYVSAAVNPGVNGGPLVDARGRLIGTVSNAVFFQGREATDAELAYTGLGKVVPVDRLRKCYEGLEEAEELFGDGPDSGALPRESAALSTVFHRTAGEAYGSLVSLEIKRKDQLSLVEPGGRALVKVPRYLGPVSGVLVSQDGFILTSLYNLANIATLAYGGQWRQAPDNAKVKAGLDGIEQITVHMPDAVKVAAKVVAHHEGYGLALLKADLAPATGEGGTRSTYRLLEPAAEDDCEPGRFVLAVGHPFGANRLDSPLLTVGMLSKRHADDSGEPWAGQWQTDAGATDANCGGAAVDVRGKLIGITTIWSAVMHGRNSGIGFVIPWSQIQPVLGEMMRGRSFQPPFMGVEWNIEGGSMTPRLGRILEGSAAEKAGLKAGDLITKVDGTDVASTDDVRKCLAGKWSGDRLVLTIQREGEELVIEVVLGSRS